MRGAYQDAWDIIKTEDPDLIRYVQPLIDGLIHFLGLTGHDQMWREEYLAEQVAEYVNNLPDDDLERWGSSLDKTGVSIGITDGQQQYNLTEFVTGMMDILDEHDRESLPAHMRNPDELMENARNARQDLRDAHERFMIDDPTTHHGGEEEQYDAATLAFGEAVRQLRESTGHTMLGEGNRGDEDETA